MCGKCSPVSPSQIANCTLRDVGGCGAPTEFHDTTMELGRRSRGSVRALVSPSSNNIVSCSDSMATLAIAVLYKRAYFFRVLREELLGGPPARNHPSIHRRSSPWPHKCLHSPNPLFGLLDPTNSRSSSSQVLSPTIISPSKLPRSQRRGDPLLFFLLHFPHPVPSPVISRVLFAATWLSVREVSEVLVVVFVPTS